MPDSAHKVHDQARVDRSKKRAEQNAKAEAEAEQARAKAESEAQANQPEMDEELAELLADEESEDDESEGE